ncbi:hypothetical protein [Glycomyces sp. NPDC047010]|uniref:hypothetical protein n=1 Tax=Glycomyces sp. NPDC047010 TaxID=3155023 RepID=UPI0033EB6A4F
MAEEVNGTKFDWRGNLEVLEEDLAALIKEIAEDLDRHEVLKAERTSLIQLAPHVDPRRFTNYRLSFGFGISKAAVTKAQAKAAPLNENAAFLLGRLLGMVLCYCYCFGPEEKARQAAEGVLASHVVRADQLSAMLFGVQIASQRDRSHAARARVKRSRDWKNLVHSCPAALDYDREALRAMMLLEILLDSRQSGTTQLEFDDSTLLMVRYGCRAEIAELSAAAG